MMLGGVPKGCAGPHQAAAEASPSAAAAILSSPRTVDPRPLPSDEVATPLLSSSLERPPPYPAVGPPSSYYYEEGLYEGYDYAADYAADRRIAADAREHKSYYATATATPPPQPQRRSALGRNFGGEGDHHHRRRSRNNNGVPRSDGSRRRSSSRNRVAAVENNRHVVVAVANQSSSAAVAPRPGKTAEKDDDGENRHHRGRRNHHHHHRQRQDEVNTLVVKTPPANPFEGALLAESERRELLVDPDRPQNFKNPRPELRSRPVSRATARVVGKLVKSSDEDEEDKGQVLLVKDEQPKSQIIEVKKSELWKAPSSRKVKRVTRKLVGDEEDELLVEEASNKATPVSAATGGGKSNFYYYDVVDEHRVALEQVGSFVGAGYYEQGSASAKFAKLLEIRYKLEHNLIYKLDLDSKLHIFEVLDANLAAEPPKAAPPTIEASLDDTKSQQQQQQQQQVGNKDPEKEHWSLVQSTLQLLQDVLPHLGPHADPCMGLVLPGVVSCVGSNRISVRKAAVGILQVHLRLTGDLQAILRTLVQHGLESPDPKTTHEVLVSLPALFPPDFDTRYGNKNLYVLVSGVARKLTGADSRHLAFMSMQKLSEVVGAKQFHTYLDKINVEQRRIYEELLLSKAAPGDDAGGVDDKMGNGAAVPSAVSVGAVPPNGVVGRRVSASGKSWVEYGAIDDAIIEKLKDDEDVRVRVQGAEELNAAIKDMRDLTPLLPQMRLFLNFLDSALEEQNFAMNLLILEIYGVLIEGLRAKLKPHLRTVCGSLLKHCSDPKSAVRIENYRVIVRLMQCVAGANSVLNQMFDHLGDKRSAVRESILNVVVLALLTFPSYEFDLKGIAASVVPTLVDPKRRVRQASQECVSVLASFMGPNKSGPLIRSVELLENHFEKGQGVLEAVQARLARRQLPRVTQEGLVEYSVQIPSSALRATANGGGVDSNGVGVVSYGKDIDWILAGTGSLSSGSAKSVSTARSESRLEDSFGSAASFPNSPADGVNGNGVRNGKKSPRSKSQDPGGLSPREKWRKGGGQQSVQQYQQQRRKSSRDAGANGRGSSRNARNSLSSAQQQAATTDTSLVDLPDVGLNHNGIVVGSNGQSALTDSHQQPMTHQSGNELLPRLTGTKSQASTASSSATRDSGISLSDKTRAAMAAEAAAAAMSAASAAAAASKRSSASSRVGSHRSSGVGKASYSVSGSRQSTTSSQRIHQPIDLGNSPLVANGDPLRASMPNVNGRAVSLSNRPGTNRSMSHEEQQRTLSRLSSKYQQPQQPNKTGGSRSPSSRRVSGHHPYHADDELDVVVAPVVARHQNGDISRSKSENHLGDLSPPRSPQYPSAAAADGGGGGRSNLQLLLRPAENSPFASNSNSRQGTGGNGQNINNGGTVSTPYSQASVPSSYEYDDDFTSDDDSEAMSVLLSNSMRQKEMSAQSHRTVASTTSSGGGSLSRIPIKRNSSMRRKKEIMDNYNNGPGLTTSDSDVAATSGKKPGRGSNRRDPIPPTAALSTTKKPPPYSSSSSSNSNSRNPKVNPRSRVLLRRRAEKNNNSKGGYATKSLERAKNKLAVVGALSHAKSVGALNSNKEEEEDQTTIDDPFKKSSLMSNSPQVSRKNGPSEDVPPPAFQPSEKAPGSQKLPRRGTTAHQEARPESDGTKVDSVTNSSLSSDEQQQQQQLKEALERMDQEQQQQQQQPSSGSNAPPFSAPPGRHHPYPLPPATGHHHSDDMAVESISRLSTANSTLSNGNYQHIQLRTQVTLKSPFEGQPIDSPPPPPADASWCLQELGSGDWESNLTGMTGVVRLARHEPELLLVEYKNLTALVLKQIKNLRSQVCRAGAHTLSELFAHLKKNMESDLDKLAVPLILKTGDTNKFLREDCHVALDSMVENLSAARVVSVATSEVMTHKNPTVRGTVARVLAYATERHGVDRILSGQRDITDKVVPAVAKLAQDGSQEARQYSKATLSMFVSQHPDWERVLRKNLTQNTMRNLEKVLEALKNGGGASNGGLGSRTGTRGGFRRRRTAPSRKTL